MNAAIRVESLGKRYLIGHQARQESYVALRDVIARGVGAAGRAARGLLRGRPDLAGGTVEEFWALKDVDFEISPGEVVGVIGRNGAGKSTLLKVLSRITEPTVGRVAIRGRVASLLEVGTGFHPELTGRENIYLNGAILGMSHTEIRRKFDEIVAFAEVERFLDTPVKRYSSGMYVRLAFAVAAHLEPEILIVDEVLAVGDAEFQKKCLGKMGEVAGHGRTVLFVSHNMAAVQALCPRGILLNQGAIVADGPVDAVIGAYVDASARSSRRFDVVQIQPGWTLDHVEVEPTQVRSGAGTRIGFVFSATECGMLQECVALIRTPRGDRVALLDVRESGRLPFAYGAGPFRIDVEVAQLALVEGVYTISLSLRSNAGHQDFHDLADLIVTERPPRHFPPIEAKWRGVVELQSTSRLEETVARRPISNQAIQATS
jgi:ABC-type polysaccharide/polyol phosphate transport system ATPase subunit